MKECFVKVTKPLKRPLFDSGYDSDSDFRHLQFITCCGEQLNVCGSYTYVLKILRFLRTPFLILFYFQKTAENL